MIDENRMSSKDHPHTATRHGDRWVVSFLPEEEFRTGVSYQQALSAMSLAWEVAVHGASFHGRNWPRIVALAGDLGLSGHDAVAMCATGEGERR
jgi:hypothetical protein